jgi:dTDP-4-dehydrorhamnose reductase
MRRPLLIVLGHTGQVGCALARAAEASGFELSPIGRSEFDLAAASPAELEATLNRHAGQAPSTIVVNLAGYTAVDQAEIETGLCHAVNCVAPSVIAQVCRDRGHALLHLSTDYVFDGYQMAPYTEDDRPNALSTYGRSKLAGEVAIREIADQHVILRTSWVYSPYRTNFVKTMLRLARERSELKIVNDQRGCPTAAADLADTILAVAGRLTAGKVDGFGTYHYCGKGVCTWFEFATEIFSHAGRAGWPTPLLRPIDSKDYAAAAQRPANSVLDCAKIFDVYQIKTRPWQSSLARCIDELMMVAKDKA